MLGDTIRKGNCRLVMTPSFERPCWFPDGGCLLVSCHNRIEVTTAEDEGESLSTVYRRELAPVDLR